MPWSDFVTVGVAADRTDLDGTLSLCGVEDVAHAMCNLFHCIVNCFSVYVSESCVAVGTDDEVRWCSVLYARVSLLLMLSNANIVIALASTVSDVCTDEISVCCSVCDG